MLRFLLDTDHLTLYQYQHPPLMRQIAIHPPDALGISPISIEETLRSHFGYSISSAYGNCEHIQAYAHLIAALQMVHLFPIVHPLTQACTFPAPFTGLSATAI